MQKVEGIRDEFGGYGLGGRVPADRLNDDNLLRELGDVHRTRHDTLLHGSNQALAHHDLRMGELEAEYLRRFPEREIDPQRLRVGARARTENASRGEDASRGQDAFGTPTPANVERADLLQSLARHRGFLRLTVRGLTDEQAGTRTTVSELCLGGLIKHVATVEQAWMRFAAGGAEAMEREPVDWVGQFRMVEGETLAGLLDRYEQVAGDTDELVSTLPDLDLAHPLPTAPWFEPGASWSVRRVLLHLIAETSQHAGHADILREALDGSKTMG